MKGNKSIHQSDDQRNLYKALVEAYESDKIIFDTYEDIVTLKRRHDDDANKDEEPSAGSDRGHCFFDVLGSDVLTVSETYTFLHQYRVVMVYELALMGFQELVQGGDLSSNDAQKGIFGRMYACLTDQHVVRKTQQLRVQLLVEYSEEVNLQQSVLKKMKVYLVVDNYQ
nr:hypothetical protein [Tanacetum cinerariifolium]